MSVGASALPLGLDPLIAEAKQRARRRRLLIAGVLALLAAGSVAGVLSFGAGGASGEIPWLPMRPSTGSANPPLAPACTASQLEATLFLQGAAGNYTGPISIVNRSSHACALVGRPRLSFTGTTGWRVAPWREGVVMPFDPLAPPRGSLRALPPGEHVAAQLWFPDYCFANSKPSPAESALVFTAPGGGRIRLVDGNTSMRLSLRFPQCLVAASTLQAGRFTPYVPQGPPSSALPLKARIVGVAQLAVKGKRLKGPVLTAHPGSWLAYTVVLTNTSKHVFRFGRTCPPYTEGIDAQNQAYVLNCHTVGAIAPAHSVRFAMRVRVPQQVSEPFPVLGWTLAPHSFNAPQAPLATLDLH